MTAPRPEHRERECCLLVLNSVTSTPQWIHQPEAAWGCLHPLYQPPRRSDPSSRHVPHTRQLDGGKTDVLLSANSPSTAVLQQRCHSTSAVARSPSWPPMPCPHLQRAATVWQERIQTHFGNRISRSGPGEARTILLLHIISVRPSNL